MWVKDQFLRLGRPVISMLGLAVLDDRETDGSMHFLRFSGHVYFDDI
jgi:hypothetical protein